MMADIIGYLALTLSLLAISMKTMLILRYIHAAAAATYVIYGVMIDAFPLMLGGALFMIIHLIHIVRLWKAKKPAYEDQENPS